MIDGPGPPASRNDCRNPAVNHFGTERHPNQERVVLTGGTTRDLPSSPGIYGPTILPVRHAFVPKSTHEAEGRPRQSRFQLPKPFLACKRDRAP